MRKLAAPAQVHLHIRNFVVDAAATGGWRDPGLEAALSEAVSQRLSRTATPPAQWLAPVADAVADHLQPVVGGVVGK